MLQSHDRIFVSIPSYRDTECQHTINDLLAKASNPNRVYIGVCFQYDPDADTDCFTHWPDARFADQIRVDRVNYRNATGPCWARFRAQQLWRGEEYYLSIDSHTRFCKGWDAKLIELLSKCNSQKPIITTYPVGYELPNKLTIDPRPTFTCAEKIGPDGMLRLSGRLLCRPSTVPLPALFWVSGFSFSRSEMIKEVPYDPHLPFLFFGEESSMTVRLWTHGWDFFAPGKNIIYHLWSRAHRPSFRENLDVSGLENLSRQRVMLQLGMISREEITDERILIEFDKYSLGTVRTLEEFEKHSGVNFKEGKISEKARWGGLPKSEFVEGLVDLLLEAGNK